MTVALLVLALVVVGALVTSYIHQMPHFDPTLPPAAVPRRRVGINASTVPAAQLAAIAKLGITQVRTSINWNQYLDPRLFNDAGIEDPAGITNKARTDGNIAALKGAGLDVVVVVHTPPAGMTLAQGIVAMPTFVAARAAQFPGTTWEILNEQNHDDSFAAGWFSATDGTVSESTRGDRYGTLIGPVYDAVKAADATAKVVTGGTDWAVHDFLSGLLGRAPGKFDAYCVHCFGAPQALPAFTANSTRVADIIGSIPLWCTEFGNSQSDESAQALDIGQMLDDNDRNNRYARTYLYALTTTDGYGVVRSDGSFRHAAMLLTNRPAS